MSNEKKNNVKFLTVNEFKAAVGLSGEKAAVIKNPNTGKLFVSIGNSNYKCQQEIDGSKEMKFIIEDDNYEEACLTNVKETTDNTVFAL